MLLKEIDMDYKICGIAAIAAALSLSQTALAQDVSTPADNNSKVTVSYGKLTQTFTYGGVSVDNTVDGYSIGGSVPVSDVISILGSYTKGDGSLLGYGYDVTQTYFALQYHINNDLRIAEGTGSKLSVSLGMVNSDISTTISSTTYSASDSATLVGLNTEMAMSKNMSIIGDLSTDINDFNLTYGIGINIGVGGNSYMQLSYSGSTDAIGSIDVDTSLVSIGFQQRF